MAWTRLELRDRTSPPLAATAMPLGLWVVLTILFTIVAVVVQVKQRAETVKPPDATFRAEEHLRAAQVTIRRPGGAEDACHYADEDARWHCGAQDFAFVGGYAGLAAGRPFRCLWLHPHPGGATTVLRWPDLSLGDHLEAHLRLLDDVAPGPPTRLQVFAAGQSLGTLTASDGREHPDLDVDLHAGSGHGELRVEISAPSNDWRLACAEILMTGHRRAVGAPPAPLDVPLKYTPPARHGSP